jgi:hypothetical protein
LASITDRDLREKLEKRLRGLGAVRAPWEADWRETANYTQRRHSRYISGLTGGNRVDGAANGVASGKANSRMFNSKAHTCLRTLANGMSSGLSSPSQPWFKLKASDRELAESYEVKVWIDDVTAILYDFLAGTTIYTAMQSGYAELGRFGTEAGLMIPDFEHGAACFALQTGEYWLGQDRALRTDTLYRDASMPVHMLFDVFPEDKISPAAKRLKSQKKLDSMVPVMHAIEPNRERDHDKIDRTNMPFRSVYWEKGADNDGILEFGGFNTKPFWAPRWDVQGMDVYSSGVGFDMLPEARKLQLQELRYQMLMDYGARPALQSPVANRNAQANLIPGGITYSAATDMQQSIRPIWEPNPNFMQFAGQGIDRTERTLSEISYADLFMAISQGMPGVQPRNVEEIARRHEEQLAQLGPVTDRVMVEKLGVIVMQAFAICSRQGRFPPVPEEVNGVPLNVEFVGVLAQAQKMLGLGAMERFLGFVGNMSGAFPQILDGIDADEMVEEYGERIGVPARVMRDQREVADMRAQRAQQEQMAQMAAMAPAIKDAAAGAELLSRTDVMGRPALDNILQPGV